MLEQLIDAGRQIVAARMVKGRGGNLSGRRQDQILMTRSGADLGNLAPKDFVAISPDLPLAHAQSLEPRPSSELSMHLAAYSAAPEIQVVLHAHPPKAISLGLLGYALPALTPDFYLHLGDRVPLLPYVTPTTAALGSQVAELLPTAPAVLLQNHGVIVVGQSTAQALLRLMLLEEQAAIYLDALAVGAPRLLSAGDRQALDEITGGRYKFVKRET